MILYSMYFTTTLLMRTTQRVQVPSARNWTQGCLTQHCSIGHSWHLGWGYSLLYETVLYIIGWQWPPTAHTFYVSAISLAWWQSKKSTMFPKVPNRNTPSTSYSHQHCPCPHQELWSASTRNSAIRKEATGMIFIRLMSDLNSLKLDYFPHIFRLLC